MIQVTSKLFGMKHPTLPAHNPTYIVESIIELFNLIEGDGETMEYIINKVGMKEQMIKQLTDKN